MWQPQGLFWMTEVSPTSAQQPWEVEVSVSTGGTEKLRSRGDSARPLPVRAERAVGSAAQRGGPPLPRPRPSDVIRRGRGLARGVPRLPANPGAGSGHLPDGKAPRGLCPARPAGGSAASHRGHLARTRLFSELLQTVVGGLGRPCSRPCSPSVSELLPGCAAPPSSSGVPRIPRWLLRLGGSWVKWPGHSTSLSPRDRPPTQGREGWKSAPSQAGGQQQPVFQLRVSPRHCRGAPSAGAEETAWASGGRGRELPCVPSPDPPHSGPFLPEVSAPLAASARFSSLAAAALRPSDDPRFFCPLRPLLGVRASLGAHPLFLGLPPFPTQALSPTTPLA